MRKITEIIVHCTATPAGREVSVAEIDSWHRQRGFKGIGYHYVVHLDGRVEAARPEEQVGAHCLRHNAESIGVCYVGGCDANGMSTDTRTPAQRDSLVRLLRSLVARYPGARIRGHCDFARKACPCFDATRQYAYLCGGH